MCCHTAFAVLCIFFSVFVGKPVSTSLWVSGDGFLLSHCSSQLLMYSEALEVNKIKQNKKNKTEKCTEKLTGTRCVFINYSLAGKLEKSLE